jgi:hypothetical protein
LSDCGLVHVRDQQLMLSDSLLTYRLNSSLFTDYAHKLRTVW